MRVVAILLFVLAADALHADWREEFKQGLRAIDQSDWPEAANRMRSASRERPDTGEMVTVSIFRSRPYLPNHHLGVALFHQGDCRGAQRAWSEAERRGFVQRFGQQWGELQRLRAECEAKAFATAVDAARRQFASAEKEAAAFAGVRRESGDRFIAESELAVRERAAVKELGDARKRLENAVRDSSLEQVVAARKAASRATDSYRALRAALEDEVRRGPVPPFLLEGARAFFSARYEEALSLLEDASPDDVTVEAWVHLFRAAALHALYRAGGERSPDLLERAAASVEACRGADPTIVPTTTDFPPGFVAFFEQRATR